MVRTSRLLGAASTIALVALSASPVFAQSTTGTTAGTAIKNTVTVDFSVGGVAQNQVTSNTDEFLVDRKVNLKVEEVGASATTVSPGSVQQVTTFKVTNLTNDVGDFALSVTQQSGGAAVFTGTDTFDTGTTKIYVDTNNNGVFDAADLEVTYLDELGADQSRTVFVVADIPLGQVSGDVATVDLTATARAGGTLGAQGALYTESATNTVDAVDTVFADGAGRIDAANDGTFSAGDDYIVSAAALTVFKSSLVLEDPINGTTNPLAIPGAKIQYCIAVTNAAGSATATNITVNDPIPAEVTYAGPILLNGTVTSGTCNTDGTAGGTFASNTVSGSLNNIAAGETKTLVFTATVK